MRKLSEYRKKRNFRNTPEPPPESPATLDDLPPGQRSPFFVQRHDASHLHFDFRLQIGGVLKSWAVPKGPSLNPRDKRLAIEVEDHPIAYGNFEGTIPKGQYGGGSVLVWDRGEFEVLGDETAGAQLENGHLRFVMHGQKLRGEFSLIRTGKARSRGPQKWLLIKKSDVFASEAPLNDDSSVTTGRTQQQISGAKSAKAKTAALPARRKDFRAIPMLATLTDEVPDGDEWGFEVKWDGVRTIAFIGDGKVSLISRNGQSYTSQFPELATLPKQIAAKEAVLDGEIVAILPSGKVSFQALQQRLGVIPTPSKDIRIVFYLFDVLAKDSTDLRTQPFAERKRILTEMVTPSPFVQVSEHIVGHGQELIDGVEAQGLEGVVAKRLNRPYTSGRSRDWLKIKLQQRDEFVICGWTEGKRELSALVLGTRDGDRLAWAGNVGTGFDQPTLQALLRKLKGLETKSGPFARGSGPTSRVHWVRPALVAEIKFAERTAAGKLRAPVFLGLRVDKDSKEVGADKEPNPPSAEKSTLPPGHGFPPFVTHPDKIYFPDDGLRKSDVLEYYDSIADAILPHLRDRPLSMKRFPNGIKGPSFFQKDVSGKVPKWIKTIKIYSEDAKRDIRYALAGDRDSLLYLVNLGCIDHNPWMSRVHSLDAPDYVLIDLDPHKCPFSQVVEAAQAIHGMLDSLELVSLVKTSGSKGIHIVVPLEPGHTYDEVRHFTETLARAAHQLHPKLFTLERSIAQRPAGRVYFDYVQIGRGKTIAAPYSVRPLQGAPVSAPLYWDELTTDLQPGDFNIRNMAARWQARGDLFRGDSRRQKLRSAEELTSSGPRAKSSSRAARAS